MATAAIDLVTRGPSHHEIMAETQSFFDRLFHSRNLDCMFENADPVDVIPAPSVEEFLQRYVHRERPVVVRGGVEDWTPTHKWTPEHLKSICGSRPIKTGVSANGDYVDYAERLKIGVEPEVEFAKAIDDIFAPTDEGQKRRVHQVNLKRWSALIDESSPIRYIPKRVVVKNIWMASTGNVTKTHYDMEDNINVQILGKKEIILYPSLQLDDLYPRSAWDYMSNFSSVEIAAPDLSRYPRFRRATPLRAVLEPGDFIYIPIYWWHQFSTLESSLNVNFWWQVSAGQALRRHGLRYWPRMARDRYLPLYIARAALDFSKSLFSIVN